MSGDLTIVIGLVVGAALTVGAAFLTRGVFDHDASRTTNHRGLRIPVGVGVLLVVPSVATAVLCLAQSRDGGDPSTVGDRLLVLLVVLGFALLGLLDDLLGSSDTSAKGFRGHLRELASGRLGTGAVKLLGGGALALVAAGLHEPTGWANWLVEGAIVALAANTANLFDRAPGRCTKVGVAAFVAVWLAAEPQLGRGLLVSVAWVVGGALGLLWGDLRERFMLGDAGANALGAAVGVAAIGSFGGLGRAVVLAVLVALNVAGELTSFSKVIAATPPLRWLDRLGRLPD